MAEELDFQRSIEPRGLAGRADQRQERVRHGDRQQEPIAPSRIADVRRRQPPAKMAPSSRRNTLPPRASACASRARAPPPCSRSSPRRSSCFCRSAGAATNAAMSGTTTWYAAGTRTTLCARWTASVPSTSSLTSSTTEASWQRLASSASLRPPSRRALRASKSARASIGRKVTAVQGDAGKLDEFDRLFAQIRRRRATSTSCSRTGPPSRPPRSPRSPRTTSIVTSTST